jgi:hypothetical protein
LGCCAGNAESQRHHQRDNSKHTDCRNQAADRKHGSAHPGYHWVEVVFVVEVYLQRRRHHRIGGGQPDFVAVGVLRISHANGRRLEPDGTCCSQRRTTGKAQFWFLGCDDRHR